jgi:hypothetical protein
MRFGAAGGVAGKASISTVSGKTIAASSAASGPCSGEFSAAAIVSGIESAHMMRKRPAKYAFNPPSALAGRFDILTA